MNIKARISGGKKLLAKIKEIQQNLGKKNKPKVDVGYFSNATYDDGVSVAAVAITQEYGTSKIPARPFMCTTITNNSAKWNQHLGNRLKKADYDITTALSLTGEECVGDIRKTLTSANSLFTPNAESTIKAKGTNSVLRDARRGLQLLHAVTYGVKS